MTLRVPTSTTYSRLERGLATSLDRVQTLQGQLASGSRIGSLSDDPVGAAAGLRLRSQEADWAAYSRAADDADAVLGTTDGALQSMSTVLRQARALAVQGTSGALDPAGRSAIAAQIADLKAQLADLANTSHLGRAVFGGHRGAAVTVTGAPPSYSFVGDAGVVSRQVSPAVTVDVNISGEAVLGFDAGPGNDVFAVLGRLETAVRTGDTAGSTAAQGELETRTTSVTAALGLVGAAMNRVTTASELGRTVVDRLVAQRSKVEDVDLAQTVLRLQAAENGYTAALGAVARANLPSLASFLR